MTTTIFVLALPQGCDSEDGGPTKMMHRCTPCKSNDSCLPGEYCGSVTLEDGTGANVCVDPDVEVAAWFCDVELNDDW